MPGRIRITRRRGWPAATALICSLAGTLVALSPSPAGADTAQCPWMDASQSPATRASELLSKMSLSDKITMVSGDSYKNPVNVGATGIIDANPALCIPALVLNDAGAGIGDQQQLTTAFPDGITQTASWDPELAQRYGAALGGEAWAKGVNVVLAPGVDIARNPLNGRNFEYAGEDPYLAGQTVAAVIRGIQSQHVVATVKHYALNDQETNRNTDSSDADERTMEEIHLPAFEAAVNAGAGAVMCSYNRVNSVYACENPTLLRTYLDKQFAFTGWVMSDWLATHSTVASANAGLDMEMPVASYYGANLQTAVENGQVSMATLNEMVSRILVTMFRLGLFDDVPNEGATAASTNASTPQDIAIATRVAEEGTVLLKNSDGVLPISGTGMRIAVIGDAAGPDGAPLASQGYGSGHVPEAGIQPGVVSPLQAISSRAQQDGDVVTYAGSGDATVAAATAAAADTAVVFINDVETEGSDRADLNAHSGTCALLVACSYDNVDQNALVSAVAASNKHTIVIIQSGGPVAMPWLDNVAGVVENWYPGQVDGNAITPLLFGDANFSGKLPVTFPKQLSDDPLQTTAQYPGVMVDGDTVGPHSSYSEGLLVGYRWYDAKHIAPRFPFGYGLSYTTFAFSNLQVATSKSGTVTVTATVTNTGSRGGSEVAQLYVTDPAGTGEPPLQLKGFQRVTLAPGQSAPVTMTLDQRAFSIWNTSQHAWQVSPGCYGVSVGDSSANLPVHAQIPQGRGAHC